MAIKVVLLLLTLFIIISLQTVEISFVKQNLIVLSVTMDQQLIRFQ